MERGVPALLVWSLGLRGLSAAAGRCRADGGDRQNRPSEVRRTDIESDESVVAFSRRSQAATDEGSREESEDPLHHPRGASSCPAPGS